MYIGWEVCVVNDDLATTLEQLSSGTAYPPPAFHFVLQGLEFAKTHVRHEVASDADGVRHFDAVDLCWCLHDLAILKFGEHAREQLAAWRITCTADFGEIVYRMVGGGLIRASERDRREEFQEVFRFEDEFQYGPHWSIQIDEEDATDEPATEPLRTPPRFGMKTLLIAVTLFCIGASWFGWRWRHAQFQKELVEELRATGGHVYYDRRSGFDQGRDGLFGPHFHSRLVVVTLHKAQLTPELASRISQADRIRLVQIFECTVEPGSMSPLANLPQLATLQIMDSELRDPQAFAAFSQSNLHYMEIRNTRLSDEHLRQIGAIGDLKDLDISQTPLRDAQLATLANLKQLHGLTLQDTAIQGSGLRRLSGVKQLQFLSLAGSPIDDAGLADLPALPQLNSLDLNRTKITDAAISSLTRFPNLRDLSLMHTAVTSAGLPPLRDFPRLQWVHVDHAAVTREAAEEFNRGRSAPTVITAQWLFSSFAKSSEASAANAAEERQR